MNGWSPIEHDESALWAMKMRMREAMPWYLALLEGRRVVRGQWAKDFFYAWICDFRLGSCLHESKWPDVLWYMRAFKAEKARWMRSRRPYA